MNFQLGSWQETLSYVSNIVKNNLWWPLNDFLVEHIKYTT